MRRIDIINRLDSALDDWCAQCLKLDADTCDNCMARYFDAWLEDRRIEKERNFPSKKVLEIVTEFLDLYCHDCKDGKCVECRIIDVFQYAKDMGGEE